MMSSCHSSIARERSQRWESWRRRRRCWGWISPWRTSARYRLERPGSGTIPSRPSWVRMLRGPQPGCARRSATTRASTEVGSGGDRLPAWSSDRPAHPDPPRHSAATSHAASAGQPRTGAPPPPPSPRRQGPPAQPGSAAPPAPTPPARCRPPPLAPAQGAQRRSVEPADQPATVTHLPEPLSPRTRSRVRKLSASSRSHSGKHEPDSHRAALNAPAACSPPAAVRAAGDDH
jgi:hypothetical protein